MERKSYPLIDFLKPFREDTVLDSAGRLFQSLAPRKEKHFCRFAGFFFLVKRLHRYCGAKSLSDMKTIVLDSLSMSSSMVIQPNSTISGLLGVSKSFK